MKLYSMPQIISALCTASFCSLIGISISYLAILLPHFTNMGNTPADNEFTLSHNEMVWLLSSPSLVKPVGSIAAAFVIDYIGRLNTLRLTIIPWLIGWLIIANATNFSMLMIGIILAVSTYPFYLASVMAYIAEISPTNIRGSLLSLKSLFIGIGTLTTFLLGFYLNWRTVAWINCLLPTVPVILSLFLHESMLWFIAKGRVADARKSLVAFNRYVKLNSDDFEIMIQRNLRAIQEEDERHQSGAPSISQKIKFLVRPTGYRRVLMIVGLLFFRECTGMHVIVSNVIVVFKDFGVTNPSIIGVYIGLTQLISSICCIWLMKHIPRRRLIIISDLMIGICVLIFGIYIDYGVGSSNYEWIPLCTMIVYVFTATSGMLTIPLVISIEIFPTHFRGTGQSLTILIASFFEFFLIQTYYLLLGIVKKSFIFYYIALLSLLGCIYIHLFVVETHRKSLSEIEDYFTVPKDVRKDRRRDYAEKSVMVTVK